MNQLLDAEERVAKQLIARQMDVANRIRSLQKQIDALSREFDGAVSARIDFARMVAERFGLHDGAYDFQMENGKVALFQIEEPGG